MKRIPNNPAIKDVFAATDTIPEFLFAAELASAVDPILVTPKIIGIATKIAAA
jgi:hypothetical protein